jgi:MYXO-CTERM domain-containing protein
VGADGGANADSSWGDQGSSSGCGCSMPGSDAAHAEYAGAFFAALALGTMASRRRRKSS